MSREGTCVVLLAYDIDKGIRYTEVKQQRTKKDYAQFIDTIIREHYREANNSPGTHLTKSLKEIRS